MRHAQEQGRKVLSTFMNDRKSRKIPRCKTALTFETRAQIMLVPHCACVSYNSSGYLDTCKRFALTRVPSTRISGYLAIRIRVNAALVCIFLKTNLARAPGQSLIFVTCFFSRQEIPELNQLHSYKHNGQRECLNLSFWR